MLDVDNEVCNKGLYAIGSLIRNQKSLCYSFLSGGARNQHQMLSLYGSSDLISRPEILIAAEQHHNCMQIGAY